MMMMMMIMMMMMMMIIMMMHPGLSVPLSFCCQFDTTMTLDFRPHTSLSDITRDAGCSVFVSFYSYRFTTENDPEPDRDMSKLLQKVRRIKRSQVAQASCHHASSSSSSRRPPAATPRLRSGLRLRKSKSNQQAVCSPSSDTSPADSRSSRNLDKTRLRTKHVPALLTCGGHFPQR